MMSLSLKEQRALRVKCKCVDKVNKLLAEQNARVCRSLFLGKVAVLLEKVDDAKRTRLPIMMVNFCPFCGVKYPELAEKR